MYRLVVYFCDAYSPWPRGSNENINGLVCQYLPKGTDLSVYSHEQLETIADKNNNRRRKGFGARSSPGGAYRDLFISNPPTPHSSLKHQVLHFRFEFPLFSWVFVLCTPWASEN